MWRITGILFLLATLSSVGNGLAVAQQHRDQDEEHLTKVKLLTFGGIGPTWHEVERGNGL